MSEKYLIIDNCNAYKVMFNNFVVPNIHRQLGKQIAKSLKPYNTCINFYKVQDLDSTETKIEFKYTFTKPHLLAAKTILKLEEKLKYLGYTLSIDYNSATSYTYCYNIIGSFLENPALNN